MKIKKYKNGTYYINTYISNVGEIIQIVDNTVRRLPHQTYFKDKVIQINIVKSIRYIDIKDLKTFKKLPTVKARLLL